MTTTLACRIKGLAISIDDGHFPTGSAKLLNDKVGALLADRDVIRRNKCLYVATGLFQTGDVNLLVQVNQKDPFFVSLSCRLHQIHWEIGAKAIPL